MNTAVALRREFAPIVIDDQQKMLATIANDLAEAADIDVCSQAMADEALEIIGRIKTVHDALDADRLAKTLPLRDGQKWVNDGFAPALTSLGVRIEEVKIKLAQWNRVLAKRKAEEEAKLREKRAADAKVLEDAAAAERAEAEKLKSAAEAAEREGNAEAAADLFAQAGEKAETGRELAAVATRTVNAPVHTGVAAAVKGTRTKWKGRVTDKMRALLIAANRPEYRDLFEVSQSFLDNLAATHKNLQDVPGLEFYEEEIITARKK